MDTGTPPSPGSPRPQVRALQCPRCGAAIVMRSFGQAVSVVCSGCGSILDAKDPNLQILQQFQKVTGVVTPLIPLGTRGKIRGTDYEMIGFQRRSTSYDGLPYNWSEYLLFNPYKGFRYLTEYNGHWNDVTVCKDVPITDPRFESTPFAVVTYLGEVYRHFQTCDATTTFVLGEFPWQANVGEQATVTDYIHPPHVLSREKTSAEVTWSLGEYMYGLDVWSAFHLPGNPPPATGVFENQPSPAKTNVKSAWKVFAGFAILLLVLMIGCDLMARKELVLSSTYKLNAAAKANFFTQTQKEEPSFVTDIFELKGRTSDVEIKTSTNVDNSWVYLNYALINQDTGQAWDFGREVSYYHGYDSDGSWHEGKDTDTVTIPSVPSGHYYLRIEPESDPVHPQIVYQLEVKRDVPVTGIFGVAFLALLVPAIIITWRSLGFERARWSESDHPSAGLFQGGSD
jgi:Domain of unknown function (DUF4178)